MKTYQMPIEITLTGSIYIEAEDIDAAYEKADETMFWAYQNGAPENHEAVSIVDCSIEVDGEEIDLDTQREEL